MDKKDKYVTIRKLRIMALIKSFVERERNKKYECHESSTDASSSSEESISTTDGFSDETKRLYKMTKGQIVSGILKHLSFDLLKKKALPYVTFKIKMREIEEKYGDINVVNNILKYYGLKIRQITEKTLEKDKEYNAKLSTREDGTQARLGDYELMYINELHEFVDGIKDSEYKSDHWKELF